MRHVLTGMMVGVYLAAAVVLVGMIAAAAVGPIKGDGYALAALWAAPYTFLLGSVVGAFVSHTRAVRRRSRDRGKT